MSIELNIERPLGPTEELYYRFDPISPINFGTICRLAGPIDPQHLRQALNAVQQRHPLLRVRVEPDEKQRPWFRSGVGEIPLTVLKIQYEHIWQLLEQEINLAFDTSQGPLMRALLAEHGPDDTTLVFIFHHSVSDGRSATYLYRDVLQSITQQVQGKPAGLPKLEPVGYYGDRIPKIDPFKGTQGIKTAWKTLRASLEFLDGAGLPVGLQQRKSDAKPIPEQQLIIEPRYIDAKLMKRIASKAKTERTTVQCVLNAALSLTVATDSPTHPLERTACTQVLDIRDRLQPPIGEDVGCFASGASSLHHLTETTPFWPLTRRILHHLKSAIVTPLPFFFASMHKSLVGLGRGLGMNEETFSQFISRVHPEGLAVSNLGRVVIEVEDCPLKPMEFGFATNTLVLNYLNTSAATMNGKMIWTFNGGSALSRERIARIADGSVERIIRALEE